MITVRNAATVTTLGLLGAAVGYWVLGTEGGKLTVETLTRPLKLDRLLPEVKAAFLRVEARMAKRGIRLHVGSTARTLAEELEHYVSGRSATTRSWHMVRRALDVYPYGPDGKIDVKGQHVDRFRALHEDAAAEGFRGLAFNDDGSIRYITTKKGKVWDAGHIEFRGGLTWAQAAKQIGLPVVA